MTIPSEGPRPSETFVVDPVPSGSFTFIEDPVPTGDGGDISVEESRTSSSGVFPEESFPEMTTSASVQMSSDGRSSNIIMPWTSASSHRPTQRTSYTASSELPTTTYSPQSTKRTSKKYRDDDEDSRDC